MWTMSFAKSVPEGLKLLECERGIGGKNSSIHYIPKMDHVQEALEKNKKINYFKLTLPHMGSKLKVGVRYSRAVHSACALSDSRMQTNGA